ncbi:conjugal transfer protein (plasmid) [Mycolicibacterium aichiense]|uniref:conjugal transfer protein n=1 Tax=Mycolicibacterium aichiense TaxID=1799 RepID=UPI003D667102
MSAITLSRTWQNRINHGRLLARRIGVALLAVGALMGTAASIKVFLVAQHPDDADVTATAYRLANQRDAVGARAATFVAAVLTTPESDRAEVLQRFITLPKPDTVAPPTPAGDPAPAVIDTPRVWSVMAAGAAGDANLYSVIVTVEQRPYASAPPTTAFYRVPMSIWHYQPRPMDMPTPISDPGPGADVTLGYDHALSPTSPVYAVVAGFITTYLTSTSGLDRYVVADSWIKPIGGYQSVLIRTAATDADIPEQPATGAQFHVRVTATASTSQFATVPFTFPLTVENSGGTWMIADIGPAPQVVADSEPKPVPKA